MSQLELIIPAYNESLRIEKTLRSYAERFPREYTITVVLNGCTDDTRAVVDRAKTAYLPTLNILEYPEPIGKGGAIIRGWKQSSAEVVAFVDADLSTSPEEMMKIINALGSHDGVIASRFLSESTIMNRQSPLRTLMSKIFALCVKLLFGMPFSDTQCGAKVFRREVVATVLDQVQSHNMAFDVELLYRLRKNTADIIETPTYWIDQKGSASLHSPFLLVVTGFKMLKSLVRLRFS